MNFNITLFNYTVKVGYPKYLTTLREEVVVTIDNKENKFSLKECAFEIFVPDETLFTKGTLRSFKLDFKGVDFKNKYMERLTMR